MALRMNHPAMNWTRPRSRAKAAGEMQQGLFDGAASGEAKRAGMAQAAEAKGRLLAYARGLAREIACARPSREVTADDVQAALVEAGVSVHALGNAAGSLFAEPCWQYTGRWEMSKRVHAHRNPLRVWRYIG
jgi:hypothetical protein